MLRCYAYRVGDFCRIIKYVDFRIVKQILISTFWFDYCRILVIQLGFRFPDSYEEYNKSTRSHPPHTL